MAALAAITTSPPRKIQTNSPNTSPQSSPQNTRVTGNVSPRTKENPTLQTANKNVFTDNTGKCTLKIAKGSRIRKIAVLSDLHIGVNGSKTCGFKQNDDKFAAYLTRMIDEMNYDLIIINGDCFELWEPGPSHRSPHRPRTQDLFSSIVRSWPLTSDILLNCEHVILLNGNHDACMRTSKMVEKCYADIILEDFSLYIAHGHQSDIWCADDSLLLGVAQLATSLYGHVELIKHSMDEDIDVLEKTIKSTGTKRCDFRAMTHAEMVSEALGCKIVTYGHTHNPLLLNTSQLLYCNSGNCCTLKDHLNQLDFILRCPMSVDTSQVMRPPVIPTSASSPPDGEFEVKAVLMSINVATSEQTIIASAKRTM
ncbi:MAG: metallophosphoesterase family protein [Methylococcales bacterium]|nr:metallophosphoesterase family protein [Methylococcales bacterium]